MPEIDIWYDRVDVDKLIGHLAPHDADEVEAGSNARHVGAPVVGRSRN
jgi:hypothetical protein